MFTITTISPLDDKWEERDKKIEEAAGRRSDSRGSGSQIGKVGERDHVWNVSTFEQAIELKERLKKVEGVKVSLREAISHPKKGKK